MDKPPHRVVKPHEGRQVEVRELTLKSVRDLVDPFTGEVWSEAKKRRFIQHSLEVERDFMIGRTHPDTIGLI